MNLFIIQALTSGNLTYYLYELDSIESLPSFLLDSDFIKILSIHILSSKESYILYDPAWIPIFENAKRFYKNIRIFSSTSKIGSTIYTSYTYDITPKT